MRGSSFVVLALMVVWALPGLGQTPASESGQSDGNSSCKIRPSYPPYTAFFKITHVRTLGNGATITREATKVEARDSQRRKMTAMTWLPISLSGSSVTTVNVENPQNGTHINWTSDKNKATVVTEPPMEQRIGCWTAPGFGTSYGNAKPNTTAVKEITPDKSSCVQTVSQPVSTHPTPGKEDLGITTIQGIQVHGTRYTHTIPAGQFGNDRPLVHVEERWTAVDIPSLNVREILNDPQNGKETRELVKLDRNEPDPAIFQPPANYEVVPVAMVPCSSR